MREACAGLPKGKFLRRIGYSGLDVLITNSANAACQVQALEWTNARVQVVPNGVLIPQPLPETERNRLRVQLGCSSGDLLIGSIGRIDENKNYSMLLRVFASLTKKWLDLRLLIIGDGPLKSHLVAMAEGLGVASKVRFPGPIPMAARYLPVMDVCCLTSFTEGMPNVIMEAAAAGLPVVSTRCGDTMFIVEDGVSGYLVSPDDDISMSAYLDLLLANPEQRSRMGQAGREKMLREFSVTVMVERITGAYEEVLNKKRLSAA
jgi:glycosyltransferase involved in cell wall biosynthesis